MEHKPIRIQHPDREQDSTGFGRAAKTDRSRRDWVGRVSAGLFGVATLSAQAATASAPEPRAGHYRLALALGGGCIRAFAHIGVIKVLDAAGIRPDLIVGTSAGSMVGALYAAGLDAGRLENAVESMSWSALQQWRLSKFGIYSLEPMRLLVNRHARGKLIEQFPTRFAAVATELRSGAAAALDRGEPGLAVMASSSVPGLVRPTVIDHREYIDGGVICPIPVSIALGLGAATVIGVDVSFPPEDALLNDAIDVALQSFTIATRTLGRDELARADVAIAPQIGVMKNMSLDNAPALIATGEQAARRALPAIRAALARTTPRS